MLEGGSLGRGKSARMIWLVSIRIQLVEVGQGETALRQREVAVPGVLVQLLGQVLRTIRQRLE